MNRESSYMTQVEIGYVVPNSRNFAYVVRFFPNPKNRTKQGPPVDGTRLPNTPWPF